MTKILALSTLLISLLLVVLLPASTSYILTEGPRWALHTSNSGTTLTLGVWVSLVLAWLLSVLTALFSFGVFYSEDEDEERE